MSMTAITVALKSNPFRPPLTTQLPTIIMEDKAIKLTTIITTAAPITKLVTSSLLRTTQKPMKANWPLTISKLLTPMLLIKTSAARTTMNKLRASRQVTKMSVWRMESHQKHC